MMERLRGCFRSVFAAVGCATVLMVGGVAGWKYRAQLGDTYRWVAERWRGAPSMTEAARDPGVPSREARRSAERKEAAIGRRDGPAYVVLTASELAALIEDRLDPVARAALDSIRVTLDEGRFGLAARLRTDGVTAAALGPVADILGPRQPIRMVGPVEVAQPGAVRWAPDEVVIHKLPLPRAAILRLVDHLTGESEGVFIIPVPPTVGDVRVRASGVTFYRRIE